MRPRRAPGEEEPLVNLRPVKEWATSNLGPGSVLRKALEWEQGTIRASDLVAKLGVWLQILDMEESPS